MHLADLGAPTKPWAISEKWSRRVMNEFFKQGSNFIFVCDAMPCTSISGQTKPRLTAPLDTQGDEEKKLGLPVGPLNDRDNVSISTSQKGLVAGTYPHFLTGLCPTFPVWHLRLNGSNQCTLDDQ